MLSRSAFSTLLLSFALVAWADVTPTAPSPGAVFQQGSSCTIGWTPDQTGTWKTLNIELMTGDNFNMVHLTTVATVDGTTSPGTFTYTCPAVTPPAPIYFYQFTSPSSSNRYWTGRFTISDSTGATVAAPNQTQPNGQAIPWGTGALVNPSTAVAAPPYLTGGNATSPGTSSNSTSAAPSSSVVLSATSSVAPSSSIVAAGTPTPQFAAPSDVSSSGSAAAASSTGSTKTTSSGSNSGGALVLGTVSARSAQAGVALAVIAGTFTFLV